MRPSTMIPFLCIVVAFLIAPTMASTSPVSPPEVPSSVILPRTTTSPVEDEEPLVVVPVKGGDAALTTAQTMGIIGGVIGFLFVVFAIMILACNAAKKKQAASHQHPKMMPEGENVYVVQQGLVFDLSKTGLLQPGQAPVFPINTIVRSADSPARPPSVADDFEPAPLMVSLPGPSFSASNLDASSAFPNSSS